MELVLNELGATICNELAAEIDNVLFMDFRVGGLLSDTIFLDLHRLPRSKNVVEKLLYHLRCLKHVLLNPGETDNLRAIKPSQVLFLYQSDRPDYLNFTKPIVERIGYENAVIYGISHHALNAWPACATVLNSSKLPWIDKLLWIREFSRCYPLWKKILADFERKYNIEPLMPILRLGFIYVTQQLMRASNFLSLTKPAILFTDYDRSTQVAPFIMVANSMGIPTVTSVHNQTVDAPSFAIFPSIAEYVCCWGEMMFNNALDHHEPLTKLRILGNQNFFGKRNIDHQGEISANDQHTITLALSPFRGEVIEEIIDVFVDAVSYMDDVNGIIRLHPTQNRLDFMRYDFDNICISSHDEIDKNHLIQLSSVVVGHETSFLNDSIVLGTPVVALDILNRPLLTGSRLRDYGDMPIAQSGSELQAILDQCINDSKYREKLYLGIIKYCNALNCATGDQAADNIYNFLISLKKDSNLSGKSQ